MNSERLAQDPGAEKVPEAVCDEVGIVVAAFPARDRHGEEDKGGGRRPKRCGPRRQHYSSLDSQGKHLGVCVGTLVTIRHHGSLAHVS